MKISNIHLRILNDNYGFPPIQDSPKNLKYIETFEFDHKEINFNFDLSYL